MNRNLDGIYFRVKRDDTYENICFSDLTQDERAELFDGDNQRSADWWKSLAYHLADVIRQLGDDFDIVAHFED